MNVMGSPRKPNEVGCVGRGGAAERVSFRACAETNDTELAPTMGSLFDGIGGFPLAAVNNGVVPLWASEIERFPIKVTSGHFPNMLHLGDITKLKGADLPPVGIIAGGSPCQDLSVAGARAGLAGARSGLFMEQIRITKELRDADILRGEMDIGIKDNSVIPGDKAIQMSVNAGTHYDDANKAYQLLNGNGGQLLGYTLSYKGTEKNPNSATGKVVLETVNAEDAFAGFQGKIGVTVGTPKAAGTYTDTLTFSFALVDVE